MNEDLLRECFEGLRKDAASGIDKVTKEEYGNDLDSQSGCFGRSVAQDVVYSTAGTQSVYPQSGEYQAEAVGDSVPGRQAGAGRTGADTGVDL